MATRFLGGVFILLTALILSGCGLFAGEATAIPTAQERLKIEIQAPERVEIEPPRVSATVPMTITTSRGGRPVSSSLMVTLTGPITRSLPVTITASGVIFGSFLFDPGSWKITATSDSDGVEEVRELVVVQRQLVQVPTPTPLPPTPAPTRVPVPTLPPPPTPVPSTPVPAAVAPAPKAGVPNAGIDLLDPIDKFFAWLADSLRGR